VRGDAYLDSGATLKSRCRSGTKLVRPKREKIERNFYNPSAILTSPPEDKAHESKDNRSKKKRTGKRKAKKEIPERKNKNSAFEKEKQQKRKRTRQQKPIKRQRTLDDMWEEQAKRIQEKKEKERTEMIKKVMGKLKLSWNDSMNSEFKIDQELKDKAFLLKIAELDVPNTFYEMKLPQEVAVMKHADTAPKFKRIRRNVLTRTTRAILRRIVFEDKTEDDDNSCICWKFNKSLSTSQSMKKQQNHKKKLMKKM